MSVRSLLLVPLVASGFLAAPLRAERVLVGGPDGFVMQTDSAEDALTYFTCTCNGPIRAMTADGRRLYVADEFETIVMFDLDGGGLRNFMWAGIGQINALAASGGELFVGSDDGRVARMDPLTGTVLDVRFAPAGIKGLAVHAGHLVAATADGALYRAPLTSGDFQYFTCFCVVAKDIALVGDDLMVMDEFGTVVRVDASTGGIVNAFWVGEASEMAAGADGLFFYYETPGVILRFDPATGLQLPGTITSPIGVDAMLAIPEVRKVRRAAPLTSRRF
jgi:outer membrane protein assembly factor BamB